MTETGITTLQYNNFGSRFVVAATGVPRSDDLRLTPVMGSRTDSRWAADTTSQYVGINPADDFARHFAKLAEVQTDAKLWSEGAEAPSPDAAAWAWLVLQQFREDSFLPSEVVASAEGGIAICFVNGNKYADLECLNNGLILAVTSNRRDRPLVWEVEQSTSGIARASAGIRAHLDAPSSGKNASMWQRRR